MRIPLAFSIAFLIHLVGTSEIYAQSMWLHKPVYTSGLSGTFRIASTDTAHFIISPGGFSPALTSNYGSTWEYRFVGTRRILYNIPSLAALSNGTILLGCNDERTYYIHNGNTTSILKSDGGHIVRTSDGGITWADTAIGSRDTNKIHNGIGAITALDSLHIFLPIVGDHYLHSSDGGISWQSIPAPVTSHYAWWDYEIINPIAAYPAPNTLIVSEVDTIPSNGNYFSKIYRSSDLGTTWNEGFRLPANLTDIKFVTPMLGFATGYTLDANVVATSQIFKTADGGATWQTIYNRIREIPSALFGVAFADVQHGIAVGDNGTALRTSDGGSNWTDMKSDFSKFDYLNTLLAVAYPDTSHAMIASGSGEVLIYHPDTLLEFPEIIEPAYAQRLHGDFEASWRPISGATHYRVRIAPESSHPVFVLDTVVSTTSLAISGLSSLQYTFYLTAYNDSKTSNEAVQPFYEYLPSSVVNTLEESRKQDLLTVFPNPASSTVHCQLQSRGTGPITLEIDDVLGRKIVEPGYQHGSIGLNGELRFDLDLHSLNAGSYLLRVKGTFGEITKQIVVTQ